jgi:hypothetical protein
VARTSLTPGQWLVSLSACKEGVAWLGNRSVYYAWRYCPHADYLCWLYGALDSRLGVRSAIAIARHMTAGVWFDRRLEEVYDSLFSWSGSGSSGAHHIRVRAHSLQTVLNEHPLAKALTWAAVCATATTPALAGEAASLSCVASVESAPSEKRAEVSQECAELLRSVVSVNEVEQAWKRVVRANKR